MTLGKGLVVPVSAASGAPRGRLRQVRHSLERLSIYMPVVLMGLLAMGSYWLLRSTPPAVVPTPVRPAVHEATDVMRRFSVRTYSGDGTLRSEVFGQEARRFPDDRSMEIDHARVRAIDPNGSVITAEAERIWVNAGHEEYELTGNAVVVREAAKLPSGQVLARLEFQGEHLYIYAQDKRLLSRRPVLLLRGADRITADHMDWSERDGVAHLTGRVRAQLSGKRP